MSPSTLAILVSIHAGPNPNPSLTVIYITQGSIAINGHIIAPPAHPPAVYRIAGLSIDSDRSIDGLLIDNRPLHKTGHTDDAGNADGVAGPHGPTGPDALPGALASRDRAGEAAGDDPREGNTTDAADESTEPTKQTIAEAIEDARLRTVGRRLPGIEYVTRSTSNRANRCVAEASSTGTRCKNRAHPGRWTCGYHDETDYLADGLALDVPGVTGETRTRKEAGQ